MKQKMKQFEDSIVQKKNWSNNGSKKYLQITLFLKCTFDICLSYKITRKSWITIYECLQDNIHVECHFIIDTRLYT
jgi:hypothetical protein